MNNINFTVDENKCIHCEQCCKDCVAQIIHMNAENIPTIKEQDKSKCIKCQHCLAICPVGAISVVDKQPQNSKACDNFPDSEKLLNLIQSRRSFRQYKHENLPPEIMLQLKEMLKFPPTGCNNHNLHFSIIEDVEVMDRFRNRTNNKIKKLLLSFENSFISKTFEKYKNVFLTGEDVIFRGAPHMIVVSSPVNAPCANEDGIISLSYFELYAQSLKIGTLWCGFAQLCLKIFPDLCEFLEIPEGFKPVYVMLFGPTDTHYSRTVQPESYPITTVKGDKDIDNLSISKKIKRHFWNFIR